MEESEIKQEICDDFQDIYNKNNDDLYVDIPQYVSLASFVSVPSEPITEELFSLNTNHLKLPSKEEDNSKPNSTYLDLKIQCNEGKKRKRQKYIPSPKTCELCGKQLSCTKGLRTHMRIHNDEKPFECEMCGKTFRQSSGLRTHLLTHSKEKPYPCPDCDGTFTTSSSMKRHRKKIHEAGKQFTCNICLEVFYSMVSYRTHRTEKHSNVFTPKRCRECGEMMNSRSESKNHWRIAHKNKIQWIPRNNKLCLLCGKEFSTFPLYLAHKYEHLQYTKDELKCYRLDHIYPCKTCHKLFSNLNVLTEHLATHMEATYKCELCNEKFSYYLYNKHRRKIHDEIQCPICKQLFNGILAFRSHKYKTHFVTHRVRCKICYTLQYSESSLKVHMTTYHGDSKSILAQNRCFYCNQYFHNRGNLSRHVIEYHSTNLEKLSCHMCKVTFNYHYEFHQHMQKVHQKLIGYNTHKCTICKKSLNTPASFKSHMYKHRKNNLLGRRNNVGVTNRKTSLRNKIKCKECGKIYPSHRHFKKHVLVHSIKCMKNNSKHVSSIYPAQGIFHCDFCDSEFFTFKEMLRHRKTQSHRKKFHTDVRLFMKNSVLHLENNKEETPQFIKNEELEIDGVKEEPNVEETNCGFGNI